MARLPGTGEKTLDQFDLHVCSYIRLMRPSMWVLSVLVGCCQLSAVPFQTHNSVGLASWRVIEFRACDLVLGLHLGDGRAFRCWVCMHMMPSLCWHLDLGMLLLGVAMGGGMWL